MVFDCSGTYESSSHVGAHTARTKLAPLAPGLHENLHRFAPAGHHTHHTDVRLLERVQRRWTRHIDGMTGLSYGERLRALNLYSVQGRLLRADLIQYWKTLNGHSCIAPNDLFQHPPHSITRDHCLKVFPPVTVTDMRKRFFSIRHISMWNSLPTGAVCAPSVPHLKRVLDTCIRDQLFNYPD